MNCEEFLFEKDVFILVYECGSSMREEFEKSETSSEILKSLNQLEGVSKSVATSLDER